VKSKQTKKARAESKIAAIAVFNELGVDPPRWGEVKAKLRFYFRTKARHDRSNAQASTKAYEDGLTDAGVWLDDSGVTWLPVELLHDPKNPRLEIEINPN
jgi:Holliday junction resolvase RusA-like endonuclease